MNYMGFRSKVKNQKYIKTYIQKATIFIGCFFVVESLLIAVLHIKLHILLHVFL